MYYSFSTDCLHCPHKSERHFLWWNKYITEPLRSIQYNEADRDALVLLKHKILKSLLLKRTKKERAAELALPLKTWIQVTLRVDSLDVREYDYKMSLLDKIKPQLDKYKATTLDNNYVHLHSVLMKMHVALTPLQQAVDHCYLVEYSSTDLASGNAEADDVEQSCSVCHDAVEDPIESREEIRFMVEGDGSAKGIVFSQFTSFLDLIHYSLKESSINCVQLVGSISVAAGDAAVTRFTEDPDCRILPMSLKAGGVASILQLHHMIVKFVIENTIEEWILDAQ